MDERYRRTSQLPIIPFKKEAPEQEKVGESFIGNCTTLKIVVRNVKPFREDHWKVQVSSHLLLQLDPMVKTVVDPWDLISNFKQFNDFHSPVSLYFGHLKAVSSVPKPKIDQRIFTKFDVLFAYLCCESLSHHLVDDLCIRNAWDSFMEYFVECVEEDKLSVIVSCYELANCMERNSLFRVDQVFKAIYAQKKKLTFASKSSIDSKIRRVIVTPSRVICLPPQPFIDSRMLRDADTNFVLRVALRDDDGSTLDYTHGGGGGSSKNNQNQQPNQQSKGKSRENKDQNLHKLENFIRQKLMLRSKNPILEIGEREYEFLGCSSVSHTIIIPSNATLSFLTVSTTRPFNGVLCKRWLGKNSATNARFCWQT